MTDLNLLRGQRAAAEDTVRRHDVDCVACSHTTTRCDRGAELAEAFTAADAAVRDEMITRRRPVQEQGMFDGDLFTADSGGTG